MSRILILDIEAVRDRSVWTPPAAESSSAITGIVRDRDTGATRDIHAELWPVPMDPFPPPFAWHPIVIGFALLEHVWGGPAGQDGEFKVLKLGTIEASPDATLAERERHVLQRFAAPFAKGTPTIVTWNGRRFDLPVLMLRSMRAGIPCGWYYGSRDTRYRFSEDGHCDLADAMADYGAAASLGLDGMAKLIGLPGKYGDIDGAGVEAAFAAGRHADIATYCLSDAVQTAFLWLRWRHLKGDLNAEEYRTSARGLLDACAAEPRLADFVGRVDRRVLLLEEPAEEPAAPGEATP